MLSISADDNAEICGGSNRYSVYRLGTPPYEEHCELKGSFFIFSHFKTDDQDLKETSLLKRHSGTLREREKACGKTDWSAIPTGW